MSTDQPQQAPIAGINGASAQVPEDVSIEQLWQSLVIKITQPNIFLPVTVQVTRPSDDGKGIYREMSLGPKSIIENIYERKDDLEVVFQNVGSDDEIVNAITIDKDTDVRTLSFFQRKISTKERLEWAVPLSVVQNGVDKTIEHAKSIVINKE